MSTLAFFRPATAAALGMLAACSSFRRAAATPSGPTPPSDANIAAIVLAANNTDISYAKLAPARAQSQQIKDFAEHMLTDHTAVNQSVNDLLAKLRLTPEDNATSLDFRDESAAKRDVLRELQGYAFDTTYIANEVSYHVKLLAAIDSVLLPNAKNPELEQAIAGVRPAVAGHLSYAQRVHAALVKR